MDVRILGQLEVESAGRRLDLGGHKQRAVLAVLVLEANRPVPVDRLADLLWDGRPPAQGVGTVRAYVSNLRRLLEPDRAPGRPARVLTSEAGGYVLNLAPAQLDASRFERLVESGRASGDAAAAAELFGRALALWRGPALADFADEPFAWAERARLEECRLVATEQHIEASLACGRHQAVVPNLEGAGGSPPAAERLREQLMVALYRCGRQADALRAFEAGRRVLAEELGVDPGPALRALERAILDHDPSLDGVPLPTAPAVPAGLVGRDGQLAVLRMNLAEALGAHGRVVLIGGEPGIGKTRLAQAVAELAETVGATIVWGPAHDGDGAPPFWPWVQAVRRLILLLALLAQAYRRAGRTEDAVAAVERGLRVSEATGERFFEAELHRIRGELLSDEESLERALLVGRRQQAASLERRAEASLARFRERAGVRGGAR